MKKFIILLTSMSFVLMSAPTIAQDNKQRRISGIQSSAKADRSQRRDTRSNRDTQRRQQRTQRNGNRADRQRSNNRSINRNNNRQSDNRRANNRRIVNNQRNRVNRQVRQNRRIANTVRQNRRIINNQRFRYNNRLRYNNRIRGFRNNGFYYGSRFNNRLRYDRFGYLLGGVVLGSTLANANHHHYDTSRVVTTRVIREGTYGRSDDVHLFRDRDGNCFEVFFNRDGDEVREEIAPEYCEW